MKKWFFVFSVLTAQLFSAGPLTHALMAQKFLAIYQPLSHEDGLDFIHGTLFPDIYYLKTTPRERTHYRAVTIDRVLKASSPFHAGVLFHAWVDERRALWLKSSTIQSFLHDLPEESKNFFLKLLEDEILYPHVDRDVVDHALERPSNEALPLVSQDELDTWHMLMGQYFSFRPYAIVKMVSVMKDVDFFGISHDLLPRWGRSLSHLKSDKKVQQEVEAMLAFLEEGLSENL